MIRRRIRSKLQKVLLHDKSGMTLVELMVTFLLLGILMAAAIATLSPAMNVCGEVGSSTGQVQIDSGNEKISYTDKKGRSVIMYAKETDGEKRLVLHYQASSIAEGGAAATKGVDWTFSKKMYMNQEIKELKFERKEDTNLVKITLTVRNVKTGQTYRRTKIVECYKLDDRGFIADTEFPQEV